MTDPKYKQLSVKVPGVKGLYRHSLLKLGDNTLTEENWVWRYMEEGRQCHVSFGAVSQLPEGKARELAITCHHWRRSGLPTERIRHLAHETLAEIAKRRVLA